MGPPPWLCERTLVLSRSTFEKILKRYRQVFARLRIVATVPVNGSTKRRYASITYTDTRASDGSDGVGRAATPFSVGGRGSPLKHRFQKLPRRPTMTDLSTAAARLQVIGMACDFAGPVARHQAAL